MPETQSSISLSELQAIASEVKRELKIRGEFPGHVRTRPRSEEKEQALFVARTNAALKYGVKRGEDGGLHIQALSGKTLDEIRSKASDTVPSLHRR